VRRFEHTLCWLVSEVGGVSEVEGERQLDNMIITHCYRERNIKLTEREGEQGKSR